MTSLKVAETLKELRHHRGFTQKQLSEQLHISRQAYSNYENGTRLPDLETACVIAPLCASVDCISTPFAAATVSSENRVPLSASTRCNDGEKRSSRCSITLFMPLIVRLGNQMSIRMTTIASTTTVLNDS